MKTLLLFVLSLIPTIAIAAGPFFVEGSNGTTPVRYKNPTIVLNFDLDMLAVTPTNAETDALVLDGFGLWNSVTTSAVILTQGNDMPVDVDDTNYSTYIPGSSSTVALDDDGLNPVIYDNDGTIIDAFFGAGQSDNVAGFAVSSFFVGGSVYTEGYAVINGKDLGLTKTQTTLLVAHEVGHFIGLDHTLVDIEENSGTACSTKLQSEYPLMYPFVCRLSFSLHQDDIISVSTLYPSTDIKQQLGQITGKFIQINGDAILGANIWAQNTSTNEVYSVVSDYLTGGTGFFSLYLPPGTYTLHANSIDTTFVGASGVGPYSEDTSSASFLSPHPITPVSFKGEIPPGATQTLTVTASEATDVTFKLDGSGTVTTGNPIFTPTSKTSSDDGGAMGPASLLLLALLIHLRIFTYRQKH